MKKFQVSSFVVFLISPVGIVFGKDHSTGLLEAYPNFIQARIESRDRDIVSLPRLPGGGDPYSLIVEEPLKWTPGQTVTVAFLGGSTELHRRIAETASEWMNYANLTLDFGYDPLAATYRQWSETDSEYTSDIRVSFNYSGYWSLVGMESKNPSIIDPSEPSMNLAGFDLLLPVDWQSTVLHEFGHAIGAHHEHQHPTEGCDDEWRWEDDPNYIPTVDDEGRYVTDVSGNSPGIYTMLGGPPNEWPKSDVDFNLRQLNNSTAYDFGSFDVRSIMKYFFYPWMFKSGENSRCYYGGRNDNLSELDKERIATIYPFGPQSISRILEFRNRQAFELQALLPDTPSSIRRELSRAIDLLGSN